MVNMMMTPMMMIMTIITTAWLVVFWCITSSQPVRLSRGDNNKNAAYNVTRRK